MALHYDTVEDASAKLASTICYYGKEAVNVKGVVPGEKPGEIMALVQGRKWNRAKHVNIKDPEFHYSKFNLGYANHGEVAIWWCRMPHKQWRQGLRSDQMQRYGSAPGFAEYGRFGYDRFIADMLENTYPNLEKCEELLKNKAVHNVAFHKDFGLSWDNLHQDFIFEYRGKNIGMAPALKARSVKLIPEFQFIAEALDETMRF